MAKYEFPRPLHHRLRLLTFPMRTSAICCAWLDVGSPGSRTTSFHTCQVLRPRRVVWTLAFTRPNMLPSAFATASAPGISILCEAQWLAYVHLYRRFAAALTGDCARLEADVVSYSFIVSDLHRLLVAGLPAHCERIRPPAGAPPRHGYRLDHAVPKRHRYGRPYVRVRILRLRSGVTRFGAEFRILSTKSVIDTP